MYRDMGKNSPTPFFDNINYNLHTLNLGIFAFYNKADELGGYVKGIIHFKYSRRQD